MTNQSVIMTPVAQSTRSLILSAARRLLVRRGFQDVVLDDVAREAGVAKGTLFLHFRNKDELVAAAFADMVDRLGEAMDQLIASGKAGKPLLEETVRMILAYLERHQDFLSLFGAGRFPSCGERSCGMLRQKFSINKEKMVKILRLCTKGMALGIPDVDYAAVALFGLCRSALIHHTMTGDKRPLTSRTVKIIEAFLYGSARKR